MLFLRYLRLALACLEAIFMAWIQFPCMTQVEKLTATQNWSRKLLAAIGVELLADPRPHFSPASSGPSLWVANHVSWLDVLVIQAINPCVFVSKSEVARWPIVGHLAKACGVIFVNRQGAIGARQMVQQVIDALSKGLCVAAFPEGTTSSGHLVGVFHANLFEAVIQHRLVVQPIALHYSDPCSGAWCAKASFVDDMDLMSSLHQILKIGGIRANVGLGEPLAACGHSRRSLAHLSHQTVCAHLRALQQPQELSPAVS